MSSPSHDWRFRGQQKVLMWQNSLKLIEGTASSHFRAKSCCENGNVPVWKRSFCKKHFFLLCPEKNSSFEEKHCAKSPRNDIDHIQIFYAASKVSQRRLNPFQPAVSLFAGPEIRLFFSQPHGPQLVSLDHQPAASTFCRPSEMLNVFCLTLVLS